MNLEEATEELLDLVYNAPVFSADPYTQRRCVGGSIGDILEDLDIASPVIDRLREEKEEFQDRIFDLKRRLRELEGE